MTDNEIIKALECCSKITFSCDGCPLKHLKYSECYELMIRSTLDLINRQKEENQRLEKEKHDLENQVAINKGAMRAYRETFENAHDEAVTDFSHFLIDKAKDGIIEICDLPDLVAEWRSPKRKDAKLMKEVGAAFDASGDEEQGIYQRAISAIVNTPSEFSAEQATPDFLNGLAHRQNEIIDILKMLAEVKQLEMCGGE